MLLQHLTPQSCSWPRVSAQCLQIFEVLRRLPLTSTQNVQSWVVSWRVDSRLPLSNTQSPARASVQRFPSVSALWALHKVSCLSLATTTTTGILVCERMVEGMRMSGGNSMTSIRSQRTRCSPFVGSESPRAWMAHYSKATRVTLNVQTFGPKLNTAQEGSFYALFSIHMYYASFLSLNIPFKCFLCLSFY
jgi:hypothetical protein